MVRHTSPIEHVLTYATFFALSLAVHMVVILGTRPRTDDAATAAPPAASSEDGDRTARPR